jgi:hypothetical protein
MRHILILGIVVSLSLAAQQQRASREKESGELDPAFFGTWKADMARSNLAPATVAYEQRGDRIEISRGSSRYSFKLDGMDYPTDTPGNTLMGSHEFDETRRVGDKLMGSTRFRLSPDGKTFHGGHGAGEGRASIGHRVGKTVVRLHVATPGL